MSEELNLPNIATDVTNIRNKEQSLYPSNIATLDPIRARVAQNLTKMYLLKYFEDNLALFDCFDIKDEDIPSKDSQLINDNSISLFVYFVPFIYLRYKKLSILHLGNYITHLYPILGVTLGSGLLLNYLNNLGNHYFMNRSWKEKAILDAKSELHTNIVKLSNVLRYPESELV